MKQVSLLNIVCLLLLATTFFSSFTPSNEQYVYIFRGGQFKGVLKNFNVYVDGKRICKLSNNKFIKFPLTPGKHEIEAKAAGVELFKKETFVVIETEAGKDNFISCNVKTSIVRDRMEMIEVVPSAAKKEMADMKEDNCQDDIDEKSGH